MAPAFGLFALIWTLWETRRAARAAIRAANAAERAVTETEKATTAALESIKIAKDTGEQQLRAYVNVERAQARREKDGSITGIVYIKNFGITPAYDVISWVAIVGRNEGDPAEFPDAGADIRRGKTVLPPGTPIIHEIPLLGVMTPAKEELLLQHKASIFVYGKVQYVDAFKQQRTTKFRLFMTGDGSAKGAFSPSAEGNEAS